MSRNNTDSIELLDRFRSASNLSIILIAFMAFPSSIPLGFPSESSLSRESRVEARSSPTLVRKHDRAALIGWADNSDVANNAEETDDTPLPLAMLPHVLDPPARIPSSIHGRVSRHPEAGPFELRDPPLRC